MPLLIRNSSLIGRSEVVKSSARISLVIPTNKTLSMFAIGGGGAADSGWAGASGYIQHIPDLSYSGLVELDITVGQGGASSGANGGATTVMVEGTQILSARGGVRPGVGWSGVGGSTGDIGGSNGEYGTGESLPNLCGGVSLVPGAAGVHTDGEGAGGIIVNNEAPSRRYTQDGHGFGAGGGEDNKPGYPGVVVITVCDP